MLSYLYVDVRLPKIVHHKFSLRQICWEGCGQLRTPSWELLKIFKRGIRYKVEYALLLEYNKQSSYLSLLKQVLPFPAEPALHLHVKEPMVFEHSALEWQRDTPSEHSSISSVRITQKSYGILFMFQESVPFSLVFSKDRVIVLIMSAKRSNLIVRVSIGKHNFWSEYVLSFRIRNWRKCKNFSQKEFLLFWLKLRPRHLWRQIDCRMN